MQWKNTEMKLTRDELLSELLEAGFTLRNCKGEKEDEHHDETVRVSTTKAEFSLLWPLRLLLALAIRTRQVSAISTEALFERLRASPSGRIV